MSYSEQNLGIGTATATGARYSFDLRRPEILICVIWLVIGLLGCQPRAEKTPPLPPPLPVTAPPLPQPVHPTFYVSINRLSLRSCPGVDCPKTSSLPLNAEVEKMGEIHNWAQIKVKKDGTMGYVSSRYLSPNPVKVAKHVKKKLRKAKHKPSKTAQPPVASGEEKEPAPQPQESSPALPKIM